MEAEQLAMRLAEIQVGWGKGADGPVGGGAAVWPRVRSVGGWDGEDCAVNQCGPPRILFWLSLTSCL